MLGRMLQQKQKDLTNGHTNGTKSIPKDWKTSFEKIDWINPNARNLVEEGKF